MEEKTVLSTIESSFSVEEITSAAKYISANYNVFLTDNQLWNLIRAAFGDACGDIILQHKHSLLANKFINLLLFKYYPCERTVKYAISKKLIARQDTVLFEMPVLGSRVDVCRINGKSYAYEIKTEFDTFIRLGKQIVDYSHVFEYVYVVVPKSMYSAVREVLPEYCGICLFDSCQNPASAKIWTKRKAKKSPNLSAKAQLKCLTTKELKELALRKTKKIPPSKEGRIDLNMSLYSSLSINRLFKRIVKSNYSDNWTFIRTHFAEILPIDVQAFFSSPIDPNILYSK